MTNSGLVHIYCGNGKGKTTAATGLALRCASYGEKVVFAQFLKTGNSGEIEAFRRLPNVICLGGKPVNKFSFQMDAQEKQDMAFVVRALFAQATDAAQDARLLVLDETMAAISCGFLPEDEVAEFIKTRPQGLEVVLTGRNPPQQLLDLADYVSEIQNIKHPYERGIPAREGIER